MITVPTSRGRYRSSNQGAVCNNVCSVMVRMCALLCVMVVLMNPEVEFGVDSLKTQII